MEWFFREDYILLQIFCYSSVDTITTQKNYERSLLEGIVPTGLKLKKRPAFQPASADLDLNWNNVLYDAKNKLVKLLLQELKKVITKIDTDITIEIETKTQKQHGKKEKRLS